MICRKCGNKIGDGKAFCVICGEPVENLEGPKFIQPDNQQPTNNGYTQPNSQMNNGYVSQNTYQQPINNGYTQPNNQMNNGYVQPNNNNQQMFGAQQTIYDQSMNQAPVAQQPIYNQQYNAPTNQPYNQKQGGKKGTKIFLIIIGILAFVAVAVFLVFYFLDKNSSKLVCESNIGNITIYYNENEITGYKTSGSITYDLSGQQEVARQIGVDLYMQQFDNWFRTNTTGSCKNHKK